MGESLSTSRSDFFQKLGLGLGLFTFFFFLFFTDLKPGQPLVTRMAAVTSLMAIWWITEAIPLAATALLPVFCFPLLGITSGEKVTASYFNSTIFLFIGGFLIALAMEQWNLHKRIALKIVQWIGGGPARLILGFMIASAGLSMWISNTATAVMMFPMGMAIILQMESTFNEKDTKTFAVGLMLGIAYSCSIGGIATLVGTPPNLSLERIFKNTFPNHAPLSFGTWFLFGVPLCVVLLGMAWVLITKVFYRIPSHLKIDSAILEKEYKALGSFRFEEIMISVVFVATALLWIFRKKLVLGGIAIPGWSDWITHSKLIDDGTVAIFMALLLFLIPSKSVNASQKRLLSVDVFQKVPWGIVLLFGGGFAMANGFQETGLSAFLGEYFRAFSSVSPLLLILGICTVITFLTELTSNTATTEMVLPILASISVALNIDPLLLMIPATISASCAFMMPVATPPNAVVFGSGRLKISEMVRVGFWLNLFGVLWITFFFYFVGTLIFGIDLK